MDSRRVWRSLGRHLAGFLSALGQLHGGSDAASTYVGVACALGATVSYGTLYVLLGNIFGEWRSRRERESGAGGCGGEEAEQEEDGGATPQTFLLLCVALIEVCACLIYLVCAVGALVTLVATMA